MKADDRELLRRFNSDRLEAFGAAELATDVEGQSFGAPAPWMTTAGDLPSLRRHENIRPLVERLHDALTKFEFGKHSIEEWERKYLFPRRSSVKRYVRAQIGSKKVSETAIDAVVNRSKESVRRWVRDDILGTILSCGVGDRKPIHILAGGTGSGKSSLNKYATSVHFTDFRDARVVATRIEYRKLYDYLGQLGIFNSTTKSEIVERIQKDSVKYLICCALRDVLYQMFTAPVRQADGHTRLAATTNASHADIDIRRDDVKAEFRLFLLSIYDAGIVGRSDALIETIEKSFSQFSSPVASRSSWFLQSTRFSKSSPVLLAYETYLAFCVRKGLRFLFIFDGFDYIQASDFLHETTHSMFMKVLSEWIVHHNSALTMPQTRSMIKPMSLVTMRTSTIECFWKDYTLAMNVHEPHTYYVAPPELKDIFLGISRAVASEFPAFAMWGGERSAQVFDLFEKGLAGAIGLSRSRVSSLFLDNTRHRVNYIRHVLEEAFRHALESGGSIAGLTDVELAARLESEVEQLSSSRNYRLVEILLQSKNDRFANFIRVERIERWLKRDNIKPTSSLFLVEDILRDSNMRSGYVGNIFNYHIPYEGEADVAFFLEKVRIAEVLRQAGRSLSREQIVRAFKARSWPLSAYLDVSLAIMIREAWIEGKYISPGHYQLTPLGALAVHNLVGQMTYLENVFFGCLMPGALHRQTFDIVRSTAPRRDWVAAAIFHVWILLRLIKSAEAGGQAFLFERVRPRVQRTVEVILSSSNLNLVAGLASRVLKMMDAADKRLVSDA